MKIKPTGSGARLVLAEVEQETIDGLLEELSGQLAQDADPNDPVDRRLFPDGYSGSTVGVSEQVEFRELTRNGLRDERLARVEACRVELSDTQPRRGRVDVELDADGCDRWLRVLNDLRLAIGTRLGITEETSAELALDSTDPQMAAYVIYGWLSAVQDGLVRIAMR